MVGEHSNPSIERELGALSANVAALILSEAARGKEIERFGQSIGELRTAAETRHIATDQRLSAIEAKITAFAGPIADYQTLRARTGYILTALFIIGSSVWFVVGAPVLAAVRKALGFPHD